MTTATTNDADDVAARVRRGALLLDNKFPGWWERVNPDAIQMKSTCGCVLGQTYGHYADGLAALQPTTEATTEWSVWHGFDANKQDLGSFEQECRVYEAEYAALAAHWRAEILDRRQRSQSQQAEGAGQQTEDDDQ